MRPLFILSPWLEQLKNQLFNQQRSIATWNGNQKPAKKKKKNKIKNKKKNKAQQLVKNDRFSVGKLSFPVTARHRLLCFVIHVFQYKNTHIE